MTSCHRRDCTDLRRILGAPSHIPRFRAQRQSAARSTSSCYTRLSPRQRATEPGESRRDHKMPHSALGSTCRRLCSSPQRSRAPEAHARAQLRRLPWQQSAAGIVPPSAPAAARVPPVACHAMCSQRMCRVEGAVAAAARTGSVSRTFLAGRGGVRRHARCGPHSVTGGLRRAPSITRACNTSPRSCPESVVISMPVFAHNNATTRADDCGI